MGYARARADVGPPPAASANGVHLRSFTAIATLECRMRTRCSVRPHSARQRLADAAKVGCSCQGRADGGLGRPCAIVGQGRAEDQAKLAFRIRAPAYKTLAGHGSTGSTRAVDATGACLTPSALLRLPGSTQHCPARSRTQRRLSLLSLSAMSTPCSSAPSRPAHLFLWFTASACGACQALTQLPVAPLDCLQVDDCIIT